MAEEQLMPLKDLLNDPEFLAAPAEQRMTGIETWFDKATAYATTDEELGQLNETKYVAKDVLMKDRYLAEVKGIFPESMQTPENINYASQQIQRWYQDSNGASDPNVKVSFRTQPFTPEELSGVAVVARAGKLDWNALPPSEVARVKEAMAVGSTNPMAESFANNAMAEGPVKPDFTYSDPEETMKKLLPVSRALRENLDLQMERHRQTNWQNVQDNDGPLFKVKQKEHPSKNIWQVQIGDKLVEKEFPKNARDNVDLAELIRDNADALPDQDTVDPNGAILALSPRKRVLGMTGTKNKGFWDSTSDLFVKHVGATSLNMVGGIAQTGAVAGSFAQDAADKGWNWITGDEGSSKETTVGSDPIGLNAIAAVFANQADMTRKGRPQSTEDMRLNGATPATPEALVTGAAGSNLSNGWHWDTSVLSDKMAGFASSIAQIMASKNPGTGIGMLATAQANMAFQEIYLENLQAGASEDEAVRRAGIGGVLEGMVNGGMMYATGRAMTNNSLASNWVRESLSKVLRVSDKQGILPSIIRGGVVNPIAAAPGNIGVNAAGMTAARVASAFIHDLSVTGDDDPRIKEARKVFGEEGWEAFRTSATFGGGLKDDVIFGAIASAVFGSTGINPAGGKPTNPFDGAEGYRQKVNPYVDRYRILKGFDIVDGKAGPEHYEINMPDGRSIRYTDPAVADMMQSRLAAADALQDTYMEGSPDKGWSWKADVTPEQKQEVQAHLENLRDEIDSNVGYNTRATTDLAIETHPMLSSAIGRIKTLANQFVLGKGTLDQQRTQFVDELLNKYTDSHKDWSAERAAVKSRLMQPSAAAPKDSKTLAKMAELEQQIASLKPEDADQAIELQKQWDKLATSGPKSTRALNDKQADAAADRWIEAQKATAREEYRAKAETQGETVFGAPKDPVMNEKGEVDFEVPDVQLGSAIQRNFGIQRREITDADGNTSHVYDIIFAQPTGAAPDASGGIRSSAADSAAAIEGKSAGASAQRMQEAQSQNAASAVANIEAQLNGKLRVSDTALLPKSAALSAQDMARAGSPSLQLPPASAPAAPAAAPTPAKPQSTEAAAQAPKAGPPLTPVRINELVGGSLLRVPKAANLLDDPIPDVQSRQDIEEGIKEIDAELNRVENLPYTESSYMKGLLRGMRRDLLAMMPQKQNRSTTEQAALNHATKEVEQTSAVPTKPTTPEAKPAQRQSVATPDMADPYGKTVPAAKDDGTPVEPPTPPVREVVEETLVAEKGITPEEASQVVDALPESEVVADAHAISKSKTPRVRTKKTKAAATPKGAESSKAAPAAEEGSTPKAAPADQGILEIAVQAGNDSSKSGSAPVPGQESATRSPAESGPVTKAVQDAIDLQGGTKLPVWLSEKSPKRPFSDSDRKEIAAHLGVTTTDPIELSRLLAARYGLKGGTGTAPSAPSPYDKGAPTPVKPAKVAEDPGVLLEERLAKEDAEDIVTGDDGLTKVTFKDETFWNDANQKAEAQSTEAKPFPKTVGEQQEMIAEAEASGKATDEFIKKHKEWEKAQTDLEEFTINAPSRTAALKKVRDLHKKGLIKDSDLSNAEQVAKDKSMDGIDVLDGIYLEPPKPTFSKGLNTKAGKPKRRQEGSTVIFSELANLALKTIKAGGNFAKYLAEATAKWGSQFKSAFEDVWKSTTQATARKAAVATPPSKVPPPRNRPNAHVSPVIKAMLDKVQDNPLSLYQDSLIKRLGDQRLALIRSGQLSVAKLAEIDADLQQLQSWKVKTENSTGGKFRQGVADRITPILSEVERISPELRKHFVHYSYKELSYAKEAATRLDPLFKVLKKLSAKDDQALNVAYRNGNVEGQHAILRKAGGDQAIQLWEDVLNTHMPELWQRQQDAGIDLGRVQRYFPSRLKSYEHFLDYLDEKGLRSSFESIADRHKATTGRTITPEEAAVLYDMELQKRGRGPGKGGFVKGRSVESLNEESAQFYQRMSDSLGAYVNNFGRNVATAEFFGVDAETALNAYNTKDAASPVKRGTSIGETVARLKAEGKISNVDVQRLHSLIMSVANYAPDSAPVRIIKNANPLLALGKPAMALAQIPAEVVISAMHNGLYNTIVGAGKSFSKTGITAKTMGLVNDYNIGTTRDWMRNFNDKVMQISGFRLGDMIPANVNMNAFLTKLRRMSDADRLAVVDQYSKHLNRPAEEISAEIAQGNFRTSDAQFIAYNYLSHVRPIGLVSMPKAYLDNNGWGRLLYNMRTWGLFQLDAMRRNSWGEIKKGNVVGGLKNLAIMAGGLAASQASMEEVVDFIYGRDVPFSSRLVDNMMKTFFLSRYNLDKVGGGDISEVITKWSNTPLFSFIDAAVKSTIKAADSENEDPWWKAFAGNQQFMNAMPFNIGSLAYWRWPEVSAEGRMKILERNTPESVSQLTEEASRLRKMGAEKRKADPVIRDRWENLSDFATIKNLMMKDAEEAYKVGDSQRAENNMIELERLSQSPDEWKTVSRSMERAKKIADRELRRSQ